MLFEVYCDESRPDIFKSKNKYDKYLLIGSLWLAFEKRNDIKTQIRNLRKKYNYYGEIKWNKVTYRFQDFYIALIKMFFGFDLDLRFRCIAVDAENVDFIKYHENDEELGFYKFYYQMLHHWILDFNEYRIFCDLKTNRRKDRLKILKRCLSLSNISSSIIQVQALPSKEVDLLQIVDLLLGAASSRLNDINLSNAIKKEIITCIENELGIGKLRHTSVSEQKFNVFMINLNGGW